MRPIDLSKAVRIASTPHRFAILKALQVNRAMTSRHLREFLDVKNRAAFGYHLRSLTRTSLIQRAPENSQWSVTPRGLRMIEMLEEFIKEKFISEDADMICSNDANGNHEFVEICRKCSYIKKAIK